MKSGGWAVWLGGAGIVLAVISVCVRSVGVSGGWGPNGRAWFDDVFWMELVTQGLTAGVAAAVAVFLYRRGQENERLKAERERAEQQRQGEERRRDELAENIAIVLHDLMPLAFAQSNDEEMLPEVLEGIRACALKLSLIANRVVGTPFTELPELLSRQISTWLIYATYGGKSAVRPPDLINHAYQLEEYVSEARECVGRWRNGEAHGLPAEPVWVVEAKERRRLEQAQQEERRKHVHSDE